MIPPLYPHQAATARFAQETDTVLNTSDPGTGKTRGTIEGYVRRKEAGKAGRMLVVAPLSILKPSWGDDIRKFFPGLRYDIATRPDSNRERAFRSQADIVLLNTDGIKYAAAHRSLLEGFTDLCVDEFTAFKNKDNQRSRAALAVSRDFVHRTLLSGTPNPNSLTDLWHPVYLLDRGARLGSTFSGFRNSVASPIQSGPRPEHVKWVDRAGMASVVSAALSDISIRYRLEECVDIPEHSQQKMFVEMSPRVMKAYRQMEQTAVLALEDGTVTAVNSAVQVNKLLQIISGNVYGEDSTEVRIDPARAELVMDLAEERPHSVVAFNWKHERDELLKQAKKRKLSVAVIDGTVPVKKRNQAIADYQEGKLRVMICHPAAAAHGITLTKGTTTIWASATYSSEHFQQLNRRIYRAGQTQKTQTIMICARDTKEQNVYDVLSGKLRGIDAFQALVGGR